VAGSRVRDCVNAAVDTLKADTGLLALVGPADRINVHIPQGTDTPYAMIMGGDEIPWAQAFGDDTPSRQVDVLVQCVSTYRGSSQVDSIASAVMDVLTDDTTWAGVSGFSAVEFVRNAFAPPADLNADGVLWFVRLVAVRVSLI
jgi:hypothetical protein